LLGVGFASWAARSAVWLFEEAAHQRAPSFPSLAEVGYLGYVIPAALGLLRMRLSASCAAPERWRAGLDGAVIATALLFASWVTVIGPAFANTDESAFAGLLAALYPINDVVLASLVLTLGMRAGTADRCSWALLGAGWSALAVTNASYAMSLETYRPGTVVDAGYVAAFSLMALAAAAPAAPQEREPTARERVVQQVVPYAPVALAAAVASTHDLVGWFSLALGVAALSVFLLRQILLTVDNAAHAENLGAEVVARTQELEDERRGLHLLFMAAEAANVSESLDAAMLRTLQSVCTHGGWEAGHAYLSGDDAPTQLRPTNLWYAGDARRHSELMEVIEQTGELSLAAHPSVLAVEGDLAWSDLLHPDSAAAILRAQRIAAVRHSVVFPVRIGSELVGVLEFFASAPIAVDAEMQAVMHHVGIQLGRAVERTRAESRLRRQATRDALTGLPNRTEFRTQLDRALRRGARGRGPKAAVLLMDLDGFKQVNDSLGHAVGDKLLLEVAQRLQDALRGQHLVARLGGDEFVVLMTGLASSDEARALGESVLEVVAQPMQLPDQTLSIRGSIGVAVADSKSGLSSGDLLRNADMAMYRAKEAGKSQVELYRSEWHADVLERLQLQSDLALAIDNDELVVHYQPVVQLTTGRVTSTEALLRWCHPTRGLVSPAEFIPMAEQTGLIRPIGAWVLEEAIRQTKQWQQTGRGQLGVAVNVSVVQLVPGFAEELGRLLTRYDLAPGDLTIEVTESMLLDRETVRIEVLRRVSQLGVHVAVDDFGTGYSALDRLRQFPIDNLKIDRSFVDQIGDATGDPLVTAVIALAHGLGMHVVAEGVETLEQLHFLQAQHCDFAQGFHFARGLSADELGRTLRDINARTLRASA